MKIRSLHNTDLLIRIEGRHKPDTKFQGGGFFKLISAYTRYVVKRDMCEACEMGGGWYRADSELLREIVFMACGVADPDFALEYEAWSIILNGNHLYVKAAQRRIRTLNNQPVSMLHGLNTSALSLATDMGFHDFDVPTANTYEDEDTLCAHNVGRMGNRAVLFDYGQNLDWDSDIAVKFQKNGMVKLRLLDIREELT